MVGEVWKEYAQWIMCDIRFGLLNALVHCAGVQQIADAWLEIKRIHTVVSQVATPAIVLLEL